MVNRQWQHDEMMEFTRHVRVIDAHGHIGDWAHFTPISLDERVAEMERIGISVSIVSSLRAISGDIIGGNDEVLTAVHRYPEHFLGYCHVSANYPELIEAELSRCFANLGMCGIKVYQNGIRYDDPRFVPVWDYASTHALPVLAHTWAGELTGLDAVATAYPDIAFLVAHAGSDLRYAAYLEPALRVPNLYLDLTYSREHPGMIELFVAKLGADRLIWGTDEPLFSMTHQLAKVLSTRITAEEKQTILSGTAIKLFKRMA